MGDAKMKILFVHPITSMSIGDVGRGYRAALERAGHEVVDYNLRIRTDYHSRALEFIKMSDGYDMSNDLNVVSRCASETIVNEALYNEVDFVLIISGLNVHPIALWLLGRVGVPAAVVLTESPYEDEHQLRWCDLSHVGGKVDLTVFTNDLFSSEKYGWHLLPPAFDPAIHHPVDPDPEYACDVVMVGVGWPERQQFLESVNWDGIDLRLYGIWPYLEENPDSPLHRFYRPGIIDNQKVATIYSSAKICLNFHRVDHDALTPGPRTFEIAGCGAFQMSDARRGVDALFNGTVPTFDSPRTLERLLRGYLGTPDVRRRMAEMAKDAVQYETFDYRAERLVATMQHHLGQHVGMATA